jgi:DsbC/DsbD-like thiol-disulfide interchange protein
VAVDVVLDASDSLVQRPILRPASERHALSGTGESFRVHHDLFELRLPLTVNNAAGGLATEITVSGEVRWQSCDDEVCDIPTSQRFELTLPVAESPPVALFGKKGAALKHFQKMSERRAGSD